MAADNKKLGDFELGGIPMAPRGHPQIEVTFDIDANGILNVSAKDKASGKAQSVTVRSSGGLSDADIEKMVQDAEANKEADAKRRETIDLKNEADQAVFNTEKQLQEHADKIPQNVKDQITGDITSLNEAMTTEDGEQIREALERLKNSSMEIGKAIYSNTSSESNEEPAQEAQQESTSEETKSEEGEKKEEDKEKK
jgi:molecular chaperone DnaK